MIRSNLAGVVDRKMSRLMYISGLLVNHIKLDSQKQHKVTKIRLKTLKNRKNPDNLLIGGLILSKVLDKVKGEIIIAMVDWWTMLSDISFLRSAKHDSREVDERSVHIVDHDQKHISRGYKLLYLVLLFSGPVHAF